MYVWAKFHQKQKPEIKNKVVFGGFQSPKGRGK